MKGEHFTRIGFILAAAGSAVGLGNVWKFPYMTGENGGGAFVFVYLLTVIFIGFSVFLAESLMGKLSQSDSVSAFEKLPERNGHRWKWGGFMVVTGILIASFYTIVIGWIFKYMYISFVNIPETVDEASEAFGNLVTKDASGQFFFFTLAFLLTFYIVSKGIKHGIEKINLVLMPTLLLILFGLLLYAMTLDGFWQSLKYLFTPDFSKFTTTSLMSATGQAFFTLSVGMGTIMTYAAALPKDANLTKATISVVVLDTLIAIVAGIIIFSIIFSFGAEPSQGAGLVFISLPPIFSQMGFLGTIIGFAFFLALAFAGITSAISVVEPSVEYFQRRFHFSREKAIVLLAIITYVLGSFALISNVDGLKEYATIGGKGAFDILDFTSSAILLPLGGLMIALFVGYAMPKERLHASLKYTMSDKIFNIWYFSIRYIAPIGIVAVLLEPWFETIFNALKF